jgi:hypothetical protein
MLLRTPARLPVPGTPLGRMPDPGAAPLAGGLSGDLKEIKFEPLLSVSSAAALASPTVAAYL